MCIFLICQLWNIGQFSSARSVPCLHRVSIKARSAMPPRFARHSCIVRLWYSGCFKQPRTKVYPCNNRRVMSACTPKRHFLLPMLTLLWGGTPPIPPRISSGLCTSYLRWEWMNKINRRKPILSRGGGGPPPKPPPLGDSPPNPLIRKGLENSGLSDSLRAFRHYVF